MKTAEDYLDELLKGSQVDYTLFIALRDAMKEYAVDCHKKYVRERQSQYDTDSVKGSDVLWQDLETP